MGSGLTVEGFKSLEEGLARLTAWQEKSVLKDATKQAAQLIVDEALTLVPVRSGKLKRAIKVRAGKSGPGGVAFLAAYGKKNFLGDEFYGAFQEFGWKTGKRGSKNRKQIKGEHFLEYAFEEKKQEALSIMLAAMRDGIEKELGGS